MSQLKNGFRNIDTFKWISSVILGAIIIKLCNIYIMHNLIVRLFNRRGAIFTFSYPWTGRESIVLGSNFRNGDFDGFTRYEDP